MSKSAPVFGRRNQTRKDKSSTMKEINCWINKGSTDQLPRKGARNVSTITENVTEERMLYSRQLELGRERYKFLVNHAYEKQKFVEKQQQKEKMMKQFMSSARKVIDKTHAVRPKRTLTVRIPQVEQVVGSICPPSSPARDDHNPWMESRTSRASSKTEKRKIAWTDASRRDSRTSRASSVLNKYSRKTPSQSSADNEPRGYREFTTASKQGGGSDRSKTNKQYVDIKMDKPRMPDRGFYVNTSNTSMKCQQHNSRNIKEDDKFPSVQMSNKQQVQDNNDRKSSLHDRSKSTSPAKSVRYMEPRPAIMQSELTTPKWAQPTHGLKRYGEKFDTSIEDPRYLALTQTLMRINDLNQSSTGVKEIIEKNSVLRYGSKNEDAAHAKHMHTKFIALILQNEFK